MRILSLAAALILAAGPAWAQVPGTRTPAPSSPGTGGSMAATPAPASPATPRQPPGAAQPATPAPAAATSNPGRRRTLQERFDLANTTHDGRLTLDQARAGRMPAVVRDFTAMDTARHGYVTLDEIKNYRKTRRLANRAARQAQTPPAPR